MNIVSGHAKASQTRASMQEFAKACDACLIEFGEYPAAIPNAMLCLGVTDKNPDGPKVIEKYDDIVVSGGS